MYLKTRTTETGAEKDCMDEITYRNQILIGDALEMLRQMPDRVVQACITSPPYWGLRDYGTALWEGGDSNCDHLISLVSNSLLSKKQRTNKGANYMRYDSICAKCGATSTDRQLGLEKTPEEYIAGMVAVFREVRRVLRDDGTLWLNIGDSYNGYPANVTQSGKLSGRNQHARHYKEPGYGLLDKSLKPKDLVGIPWMLVFALRNDGWYLRSDIIWHKPNPMPESVTDRPTKSHEYLFMMSKSQKYYYDADAIKEPASPDTSVRDRDNTKLNNTPGRSRMGGLVTNGYEYRNKRTVWTIPTQSYKDAHFATFPEALVNPCILAGSKQGDLVLDPFGGSGTTGYRAKEMGRDYTLIEFNPEYAKMAERRLQQGVLF